MGDTNRCDICGMKRRPDAPGGLCPRCVFNANVDAPSCDAAAIMSEMPSTTCFTPSPVVSPIKPGDVIGHLFEVDRQVGEGGFGSVFRVRLQQTEAFLAVKTIHNHWLPDSAKLDQFKNEASLWLDLGKHPFILSALSVFEFAGRLYIVMPYVVPDAAGRVTLADHLGASQQPIPVDRLLEWATQFCLGMEHASQCGLRAHQDIKPGNILIGKDEILKISDFGLARASEAAFRASAVAYGGRSGESPTELFNHGDRLVGGTRGYIAPELDEKTRTKAAQPNAKSDLFSFGIVLWQMVTGSHQPPRQSEDRDKALGEACCRRQADLGLQRIVQRCLAHDCHERFASFGELRKELELLLGTTVDVPDPDPEEGASHWNDMGISRHAVGQSEEALKHLRKALGIEPQLAVVWMNMANVLYDQKRFDEALECCESGLTIAPQSAQLLHSKGRVLEAIRRPEEALECLEAALEIDPRLTMAWHAGGRVLYALDRLKEALWCFENVVELSPAFDAAWANRANVLNDLGRPQEAIDCCREALAINPRSDTALNNMGNAYGQLGKLEEAIQCYTRALETKSEETTLNNKRRAEQLLAERSPSDATTKGGGAPTTHDGPRDVASSWNNSDVDPTFWQLQSKRPAIRSNAMANFERPPEEELIALSQRAQTAYALRCLQRVRPAFRPKETFGGRKSDIEYHARLEAAITQLRQFAMGSSARGFTAAAKDIDENVARPLLKAASDAAQNGSAIHGDSEFKNKVTYPHLPTSGRLRQAVAYCRICFATHSVAQATVHAVSIAAKDEKFGGRNAFQAGECCLRAVADGTPYPAPQEAYGEAALQYSAGCLQDYDACARQSSSQNRAISFDSFPPLWPDGEPTWSTSKARKSWWPF